MKLNHFDWRLHSRFDTKKENKAAKLRKFAVFQVNSISPLDYKSLVFILFIGKGGSFYNFWKFLPRKLYKNNCIFYLKKCV